MITTFDLMAGHPFLADLPTAWLRTLSFQAKRAVYQPGYRIFHEGRPANRFWLIREGSVALDISVPGRGDVVIDTLTAGTVLGWSWFAPPYRWHFGAVALTRTLAVEFDGPGVRRLCEEDPALGYALSQRFMTVLIDRLQATRVQLLDIDVPPLESAPPR